MNRALSKIAKAGILMILLSLVVSAETVCDANNTQPVTKQSNSILSRDHKENIIIKGLYSRIDILLGFGLGLLGTCFIEYLRNKRKRKEFYCGMCAELKQTLATMSMMALNPDANITKERIVSWISLSKEFNLHEESFPLMSNAKSLKEINLNEKTLNDFLDIHSNNKNQREKNGEMQSLRIINCTFIKNNISCISLIGKQQRSNLFNILRYIDLINTEIPRMNFVFEKSYDESIHDKNRERLQVNYQGGCQHISDLSYVAAKEISHLLRTCADEGGSGQRKAGDGEDLEEPGKTN